MSIKNHAKVNRKLHLFKAFRSFRLHHKALFYITGITGVVLVWRGIWMFFDIAPILSNPLASLITGFLLVILSGVFYKLI